MPAGNFIRHDPCPSCGSRDNLGVYSDGSWCFGCGYRIPGYKTLSTEDIRRQLRRDNREQKSASIPTDTTPILRSDASAWVEKYGITREERNKYRLGWSDEYESLILPAYDNYGNLLVSQRRYFGLEGFPKYHTSGSPEQVIWVASPTGACRGGTVVVVEDFISAVKVGRQNDAMPLWGSNLSVNQIRRLSDIYERLVLWLDGDKIKESMKLKVKASPYYKAVNVVFTEWDPKDYNDDEIGHLHTTT